MYVTWLLIRKAPAHSQVSFYQYEFYIRKFEDQNQIKSSLHSRYYADACNGWRGQFPRLSAWKNSFPETSHTVSDLICLGIEFNIHHSDGDVFSYYAINRPVHRLSFVFIWLHELSSNDLHSKHSFLLTVWQKRLRSLLTQNVPR